MAHIHKKEMVRFIEAEQGTKVWRKDESNKYKWVLLDYPSWIEESNYIVDDEYAEVRKFYHDNGYCYFNDEKSFNLSFWGNIEEYSTEPTKPKYWEPINHEEAWYISDAQYMQSNSWDSQGDRSLVSHGLVFETEEEAQNYLNVLEAKETIKRAIFEANEGWTPDWDNYIQDKYIVYKLDSKLTEYCPYKAKMQDNCMYIKDRKTAKTLIEKYKTEYELILGQ